MTNKYVLLLVLCFLAFIIHCSVTPVAGGSDNPDFIVAGAIVDASNQPAQNAVVTIVPASYNPITDAAPANGMTDTTNATGRYRLAVKYKGIYSVHAVHLQRRTRLLETGISVEGDTTFVAAATLKAPGTIKIFLNSLSIDATTGYFYIPGSESFTFLNNQIDTVVLDSVPAGILPALSYAATGSPASVTIRYNVPVASGDTTMVWNPSWKYARSIGLNTSAAGADIQGDLFGFPVLVRLSADVFDFTEAKTGGEDIRFGTSDGTLLPYEIEQWDTAGRYAAIWVRVDTVNGNDSAQSIIMYWGNPAATDSSSGAAVFDTALGFQGVWHLGNAMENSVRDATGNRYHGVSPDTARPAVAEGVIGSCRAFDGIDDYIAMPNTANGKLNFPENGYYTVSAWVFLDTVDNKEQAVVAKGGTQYFLMLTYVPSDSPLWDFAEFSETVGWQACMNTATSRRWTLLTGVSQGNRKLLYCNGVCVDSIPTVYPADSYSRNTSNDLMIGRFLEMVSSSENSGSFCFFKGSVDEVRITSMAESPDWVRLGYMNQRTDDRLVVFK